MIRYVSTTSKSFFWLSKRIDVDPDALKQVIISLKDDSRGMPRENYKAKTIKSNSKKRVIYIPKSELKEIQKKINHHLLSNIFPHQNVFGFSGGSINDAINPHLNSSVIWFCDIKNAFPSTFRERVFGTLRTYFSESVSQLIALLTTMPWSGVLPQGAPTSPRLFDLCMRTIDSEFLKIAEGLGFKYTRYADNIFFSGKEENITTLEKEVFGIFQMAELVPHKIKFKKLIEPDAVRLLGLNVIDGEIHNTRSFKRSLRISIYHVDWLLSNGKIDTPDFITAWQALQGQMSFAKIDTLPPKLFNSYLNLKIRIAWASAF